MRFGLWVSRWNRRVSEPPWKSSEPVARTGNMEDSTGRHVESNIVVSPFSRAQTRRREGQLNREPTTGDLLRAKLRHYLPVLFSCSKSQCSLRTLANMKKQSQLPITTTDSRYSKQKCTKNHVKFLSAASKTPLLYRMVRIKFNSISNLFKWWSFRWVDSKDHGCTVRPDPSERSWIWRWNIGIGRGDTQKGGR